MTETEHIDPTGFGLLLVAAVSLPLALTNLVLDGDASKYDAGVVAPILGLAIMIVAGLAYKANSNFGMTVFGLVGIAVYASGSGSVLVGASLGVWAAITFGIIFLFFIAWSVMSGTPKLLTALLVTTALIFLLVGIQGMVDGDMVKNVGYAIGVVSLFNFIFNFWLGAGLVTEGKIKYF